MKGKPREPRPLSSYPTLWQPPVRNCDPAQGGRTRGQCDFSRRMPARQREARRRHISYDFISNKYLLTMLVYRSVLKNPDNFEICNYILLVKLISFQHTWSPQGPC